MESRFTIVAVNGSPHAGGGSTSMMLEMLRSPLSEKGLKLEIINLPEHEIEYCIGCAFCLEKGRCWINDDHYEIVERLLAADGIILASPVYFGLVTAQMKTFIDRSLAFGHKPQPTWKPGLAVSVSAGLGEIQVAEYLSAIMRSYGAFPVGRLTALAVSGGDFIGREAIEWRAQDLAHDLARAIREKRRCPASEIDLRYYQFMGALVSKYKDTIMQDDFGHWEKNGLFEGFEKYVQQHHDKNNHDPEIRKAWIQEIITEHRMKREERKGKKLKAPETGIGSVKNCQDLIRVMPFGFNPSAAEGTQAVYQFEITGGEDFISHLRISRGECTHHEGPADHPDVIIKSPSDIWLAISQGSLDGQYAFMSGKFTAEGDLGLLIKLKSLFPSK